MPEPDAEQVQLIESGWNGELLQSYPVAPVRVQPNRSLTLASAGLPTPTTFPGPALRTVISYVTVDPGVAETWLLVLVSSRLARVNRSVSSSSPASSLSCGLPSGSSSETNTSAALKRLPVASGRITELTV